MLIILHAQIISRIGRVMIAGNLLAPFDTSILKEKHMTQKQQKDFAQPFKHLDLLLSQLAAAVPVDVMPGSNDPSNFTLPQQVRIEQVEAQIDWHM